MRALLRSDLTRALKARDQVAVAALRSALAALENAEAVRAPDAAAPGAATSNDGGEFIAGSLVGVGAAEVERRSLAEDEVRALLHAQVAEREQAAAEYDLLGRREEAERLRAEAGVLEAHLGRAAGSVDGRGRAD